MCVLYVFVCFVCDALRDDVWVARLCWFCLCVCVCVVYMCLHVLFVNLSVMLYGSLVFCVGIVCACYILLCVSVFDCGFLCGVVWFLSCVSCLCVCWVYECLFGLCVLPCVRLYGMLCIV